jgi:hypothetical protein
MRAWRSILPSHLHGGIEYSVRACRSDEWLCASLAGLAFARQHMPDGAEEAFGRARKAASAALQCQMADVTVLMDRGAVPREFVMPTQCAAKEQLAERYWWQNARLIALIEDALADAAAQCATTGRGNAIRALW